MDRDFHYFSVNPHNFLSWVCTLSEYRSCLFYFKNVFVRPRSMGSGHTGLRSKCNQARISRFITLHVEFRLFVLKFRYPPEAVQGFTLGLCFPNKLSLNLAFSAPFNRGKHPLQRNRKCLVFSHDFTALSWPFLCHCALALQLCGLKIKEQQWCKIGLAAGEKSAFI